MGLLKDLADGAKREITEEQFWYFLEVLPPAAEGFVWRGERWDFGFAEGLELVCAFKEENGRYFACKTDILNPVECGVCIADQALGKANWMKRRLAEAHVSLKQGGNAAGAPPHQHRNRRGEEEMIDPAHDDRPLPGTPVGLPLPPDLAAAFGYRGDARFVAFSWTPLGDEICYDDGRSSGTGNSWTFLVYKRHRTVAPLLEGWNLGYSDHEADHCLVLDRERNLASVAPLAEAQAFLQGQHPPAPPLSPEQAEALRLRVEEVMQGWQEVRVDPEEVQRSMEEQRRRVGRMVFWLDQCSEPPSGGQGLE